MTILMVLTITVCIFITFDNKDTAFILGISYPFSHCLGMNYYVNCFGGIGSNEFHIKLIFGTQDN